jgi:hypothetical protein
MVQVYELTNSTALGTIKMNNVMHFTHPAGGDPTTASIQSLVTWVTTKFYDGFKNLWPGGIGWVVGTTLTSFDELVPDAKSFVPSPPGFSQPSNLDRGPSLPGQLAVCLNWLTDVPGRQSRGRTFLGPIAVSNLNGPRLNDSWTGGIPGVANDFITSQAAEAPDWRFVIYSRTGHTTHPVRLGTTDGVVDVLRSRKY